MSARCWPVVVAVVALVSGSGMVGPSAAAAEPAHQLKLTTERVIAFKDGFCLTIKRGQAVSDERGEVYTGEVPDSAVLGSFWATSKQGRILSMTAGWTTTREQLQRAMPCVQHLDLLQANLGKSCKLTLQDKSEYQGVIRQVLSEPTSAPPPAPLKELFGLAPAGDDPIAAFLGTAEAGSGAKRELALLAGLGGAHFVLTTEDGDVALPIGQIRTLAIKNMQTTLARTLTRVERAKRLTLRFEKPGQAEEVRLMYFAPGLRWIPTYRIDLGTQGEKKTAEVRLQAEILNEHEDLADAPLDIVVGVPNFRFRGVVSPLSLEQTIRRVLPQINPALAGNFRNDLSNTAFTQRASEFRVPEPPAGLPEAANVDLPDELSATGAQDLFVYSLPPLRLKKGERAAVQILSAEVPYRDVYTWDVTVRRKDVDTAPSGSGVTSPLVLSKNEVWHQIELTNNTKFPWTTGVAMLVQGNQPLAQELLTYTSPRDAARVPVTVSVETRGSYEEQEIGRTLRALEWDSVHYAKIVKQARLDLRNSKSQAVDVEITFHVGGRATAATLDGKVTLAPFDAGDWEGYRGSPAVNNSSKVRWLTTLKPGESFRPTVTYEYFARH